MRFKTCGKIGSVRMQWNYINGQYEEMMFDENTTNEQLNDYDNDSMGFS